MMLHTFTYAEDGHEQTATLDVTEIAAVLVRDLGDGTSAATILFKGGRDITRAVALSTAWAALLEAWRYAVAQRSRS